MKCGMKRMRRFVWIWFVMGMGILAGEEAGEAEEGVLVWHSVFSSNQRIFVQGTQPELVQGVSVWATRSHRLLERELGVEIPFSRHVPLTILLHPEAPETRLEEVRTAGVPRQTLWTPAAAGLEGEALADAFVRAMLNRVLAARQEDPLEEVRAPDWLVRGLSHMLLEGATGAQTAEGLRMWREGRLPMIEVIVGRRGGVADPGQRAAEVLATRWVLRSGISRDALWDRLATPGEVPVSWWLAQVPGVGDLRGLHIHWGLFLSARERTAMHEHRLHDLAEARLRNLLRIRPGTYGLAGEVPRYTYFTLWDLMEEVEEPWLAILLERWLMRVQSLRFRQTAEFVAVVDAYTEAATALREAARREGRARERALARAKHAYGLAEGLLQRLADGLAAGE